MRREATAMSVNTIRELFAHSRWGNARWNDNPFSFRPALTLSDEQLDRLKRASG